MVGRRTSCDISLRFPNVSSHHCEVELINGYWRVRDLGSTNGIKVNGVRCDSKWLMPGDVLSVAKHHYEVIYSPQTDGPPPEEEDPFAKGLLEKAGLVHQLPDDMESSSEFTVGGEGSTSSRTQEGIEHDPDWLEEDD
jgi:adenylate cyclase